MAKNACRVMQGRIFSNINDQALMEYITYQDAPDDVDMDDGNDEEELLPSLGDEDEDEVPDEADAGTTPNDEM